MDDILIKVAVEWWWVQNTTSEFNCDLGEDIRILFDEKHLDHGNNTESKISNVSKLSNAVSK